MLNGARSTNLALAWQSGRGLRLHARVQCGIDQACRGRPAALIRTPHVRAHGNNNICSIARREKERKRRRVRRRGLRRYACKL